MPGPAELNRLAEARLDALVAMTRRLVRIDSQTPPSATGRAADAAAEMLAGVPGLEMRRIESVAPVVNIVARLAGGRPGPRLVFSGHIDTYPVGDRAAWTRDPLGGEVADGRLYGRGSADMKGGVVALIEAVRIMAEHMRPFPGEIALALAGDEERMGELGTQWLIDHVPEVRGDAVIVADVGGPNAIRLGEKGMIWLELEALGRQAHGAHVHAGENALDRIVAAVGALRELGSLAPRTPPEADAAMRAAADVPGADGPAARETMRRLTVNLGTLHGGVSPNLVPAGATAGLDIRIPLGLGVGEVEAEVERRLGALPGIAWRIARRYEPTWTSAESPVARAAVAGGRAVLDGPVWTDMRIGGSDARLWRRAGMDTVVVGLTPHNLGAPDECLEISELPQLVAIYCATARAFFEGSPRAAGND